MKKLYLLNKELNWYGGWWYVDGKIADPVV